MAALLGKKMAVMTVASLDLKKAVKMVEMTASQRAVKMGICWVDC